jgi:hypothetical protein
LPALRDLDPLNPSVGEGLSSTRNCFSGEIDMFIINANVFTTEIPRHLEPTPHKELHHGLETIMKVIRFIGRMIKLYFVTLEPLSYIEKRSIFGYPAVWLIKRRRFWSLG